MAIHFIVRYWIIQSVTLPIVDGGRMVQVSMRKMHGKEKGDHKYGQIGLVFLIILLLNIFYPLFSRIFLLKMLFNPFVTFDDGYFSNPIIRFFHF